jgi:low affinity Fe/Cu permease
MASSFQTLMQRVAHAAGSWPHFTIWFLLLVGWILLGLPLHWSNTWQLIANTPTTWYELFLGLALLVDGAATMNVLLAMHSRQNELLQRLERHELAIERVLGVAEDDDGDRHHANQD